MTSISVRIACASQTLHDWFKGASYGSISRIWASLERIVGVPPSNLQAITLSPCTSDRSPAIASAALKMTSPGISRGQDVHVAVFLGKPSAQQVELAEHLYPLFQRRLIGPA